ncbi:MAG TPA: hypothetical protein VGF67_18330 [Ktedonobacteraceae bacterium]
MSDGHPVRVSIRAGCALLAAAVNCGEATTAARAQGAPVLPLPGARFKRLCAAHSRRVSEQQFFQGTGPPGGQHQQLVVGEPRTAGAIGKSESLWTVP